ncbi:MAG: hypothetical protein K5930_03785 [Treponemataceae bacterium]|nr:hypothetical protein [Treponemataceae bacterium]
MSIKRILSFLLSVSLAISLQAQILNDSQLIHGTNEIYDLFYELCTEAGITTVADISPISVSELKFHLRSIDKDKLSESGLHIYKRVYDFLYPQEEDQQEGILFDADISFTPELYWKSNENTDWSFYKYIEDYPVRAPVRLGVSKYLYMDGDLFIGKNIVQAALPQSFSNIPCSLEDIDFLFPNYANVNGGASFDKFGFNIQLGRSDLTIGKTLTGSLIYNHTFETNAYLTASIWADNIKMMFTFAQVDFKRYLNIHYFQWRILPNLRIGAMEGQLIYGDPELRFFNPLMVLHNFYPSDDLIYYLDDMNSFYDVNYCAYLGLFTDYVPVKNLRLYFIFAMNEMQLPSELDSEYGRLLPDSYGLQGGADAYFQAPGGGKWKLNLEGLYTTPFMYIKQDPRWSMLRQRYDRIWSVRTGEDTIDSWIGSPFGPDCIAAAVRFAYDKSGKWSCGLEYLMKMKGEIDFDTLQEPKVQGHRVSDDEDYSGKYFCNYYPSVRYYYTNTGSLQENEALARAHLPTGIIETTHRLSLTGSYIFNNGIKVTGKTSYVFVLNRDHISGNLQHGVELALSAKYSLGE